MEDVDRVLDSLHDKFCTKVLQWTTSHFRRLVMMGTWLAGMANLMTLCQFHSTPIVRAVGSTATSSASRPPALFSLERFVTTIGTKSALVLETGLVFLIINHVVSLTLRETLHQKIVFARQFQFHASRQGWSMLSLVLVAKLVVHNLVHVAIIAVLAFCMSQYYRGDTILAILVLLLAWVGVMMLAIGQVRRSMLVSPSALCSYRSVLLCPMYLFQAERGKECSILSRFLLSTFRNVSLLLHLLSAWFSVRRSIYVHVLYSPLLSPLAESMRASSGSPSEWISGTCMP
jgi:hypothetical protein